MWNSNKYLYCIVLVAYESLVLWLTIYRRVPSGQSSVEWQPFWTYRAILNEGKEYLVSDIVNNVMLFMPIGALLGLVVTQIPQISRKWWRGWLVVLTAGIVFSVGIEALQLYLKRGLSETDDVIHNTLGCLVGYSGIRLAKNIYNDEQTRNNTTPEIP